MQKISSDEKIYNPLVNIIILATVFFFFVSFCSDCMIQLICVAKGTGLGLVIKGGANRAEGPMVFIQEIVPGGDCQRVKHYITYLRHWNIRIYLKMLHFE